MTLFNPSQEQLNNFQKLVNPVYGCEVDYLVRDNSEFRNNLPKPSVGKIIYKWDGNNHGTRQLVVDAVSNIHNYKGALFLDQDSDFNAVWEELSEINVMNPVVPCVPKVVDQTGRVVSPIYISSFKNVLPCLRRYNSAILSGAYFPKSVLLQIGPIPRSYWLDYLDHYIFLKLGKPIKVLNVTFSHNLSISNAVNLSYNRLFNIYRSELSFRAHFFKFSLLFMPIISMKRLYIWIRKR